MATDSGMDGNKAREVGSACVEVTDGDRCIAAFMIIKCIHETVAAKGYHWLNKSSDRSELYCKMTRSGEEKFKSSEFEFDVCM